MSQMSSSSASLPATNFGPPEGERARSSCHALQRDLCSFVPTVGNRKAFDHKRPLASFFSFVNVTLITTIIAAENMETAPEKRRGGFLRRLGKRLRGKDPNKASVVVKKTGSVGKAPVATTKAVTPAPEAKKIVATSPEGPKDTVKDKATQPTKEEKTTIKPDLVVTEQKQSVEAAVVKPEPKDTWADVFFTGRTGRMVATVFLVVGAASLLKLHLHKR